MEEKYFKKKETISMTESIRCIKKNDLRKNIEESSECGFISKYLVEQRFYKYGLIFAFFLLLLHNKTREHLNKRISGVADRRGRERERERERVSEREIVFVRFCFMAYQLLLFF